MDAFLAKKLLDSYWDTKIRAHILDQILGQIVRKMPTIITQQEIDTISFSVAKSLESEYSRLEIEIMSASS